MKRSTLLIAGMMLLLPALAQTQTLLGYDGNTDTLYSVDVGTVSSSAVGADSASGIVSEVELYDGVLYAADTGTNTNLHFVDPATGAVSSTLTLTFPPEGDVITSLEAIGGTLYAGLTTEGGGGDTYLSTVDLGSGTVTVVGATGIGGPAGGLAHDPGANALYAVSAGGSGELFTVDIGTGTATSVGGITVGGTPVGTTALEFGTDGNLYALPNTSEAIAGHLLQVDPATGSATDLGDLGVSTLNALTGQGLPSAPALPVPSLTTISLLVLILSVLAVAATRSGVMSRH